MNPSIVRETIIDDRRQPAIHWGAIFAGGVIAIATWVLLQTLGTGIGLASIDVTQHGWWRGVGIGTTVWSVIAPMLAMFIGGLVAGSFAASRSRRIGAIHGAVMWAVASVVGVGATVWVVMMLASGALRAGGEVVEQGASAVSRLDAGDAMSALGVNADDMLGPINQRLQAQGKPTITAQQLADTVRGIAREGVRKGSLDHATVVEQIVANTNMSREDADEVGSELDQRVTAQLSRAHSHATQTVNAAADVSGKILFGAGLTLLLTLGAAALGGLLGIRRGRDTEVRTIQTQPPVAPVTTTGRVTPTRLATTTPVVTTPVVRRDDDDV